MKVNDKLSVEGTGGTSGGTADGGEPGTFRSEWTNDSARRESCKVASCR